MTQRDHITSAIESHLPPGADLGFSQRRKSTAIRGMRISEVLSPAIILRKPSRFSLDLGLGSSLNRSPLDGVSSGQVVKREFMNL